jgi:hypothetical protein
MVNETSKALNQWSESLSKLNEASIRMTRRAVEDNIQFAADLQQLFSGIGFKMPEMNTGKSMYGAKDNTCCHCGCCPPECECPPQCLLMLNRSAYPGETVIVPFSVRNTTSIARQYKVGIRELLDQKGDPAPVQPTVSKELINLQPGQAVTLFVEANLQGFQTGAYETVVVLREKDVNQNICFRLQVIPFADAPEAHPVDEKRLLSHFQSWQSHYYCTPKEQIISANPTLARGK